MSVGKVSRQDIVQKVGALLEAAPAGLTLKSILNDIGMQVPQPKVYFTLQDLVDAKQLAYGEKQGREKAYKAVEGVDLKTLVVVEPKRGKKAAVVAPAE